MRKVILFASNFICLAEHSLSGLKAWARRVMAEWLKTPCLVSSKDHLKSDMDSSWKIVGKSMNPTTDAYCLQTRGKTLINNYVD
mgnify:CR=1 FL=1